MEQKFFRCERCGNIYAQVHDSGVQLVCCGEPMKEIISGSTDAAVEKHVPVVNVENNKVTVTVGEAAHPMTEEHFIEWVSIETDEGNQRKQLKPGQDPVVAFAITKGDTVKRAYAYCNLHSLWKKDL